MMTDLERLEVKSRILDHTSSIIDVGINYGELMKLSDEPGANAAFINLVEAIGQLIISSIADAGLVIKTTMEAEREKTKDEEVSTVPHNMILDDEPLPGMSK